MTVNTAFSDRSNSSRAGHFGDIWPRQTIRDPNMHLEYSKTRAFVAFAGLAIAALSAPVAAVAADPEATKTTIVAKVNGKAITEADMRFAEAELANDLANVPPEVKRRAVAEYLIDNMLFADAAVEAKLGDTPEFDEQMRYLRRRMLRQEYFEKVLKSKIDEAAAKKIYNAHVASQKPENEFAARHILVESEEKAKELRAKIKDGADFAELAKENSTDPGSKGQGGLLGYFTEGQMVPEFEAAVVKMVKGQVSEPVKTAFGWHVIKLEDRRRKPPPSFDSVKETILNSLAVREAQTQATALRDDAEIEYLDAGIKKQVEDMKKKEAEAAKAAPEGAPGAAKPAAKE
jgi:peptidyl-prolyl cis-trans isomerase C